MRRPLETAPKSLSIFFPAYNDARSIAALVAQADRAARRLTEDYEIIVVNDGSSDDTAAVLEGLKTEFARLRVVDHAVNRGYGGALRSGFATATKEAIFYTDGDGQYDPAEMESLWQAVAGGADFAQGYKIARHDPSYRIVVGRLYRTTVRTLFKLRVRDVDCDFRLMRREVLDRIGLRTDSGAICVELVKRAQEAGFRFAELPVHHYPRQHGRSEFFRVRPIARLLIDLARLFRELG
jgi:glycosyltransferase involved in cell wall biosynthesis